MKKSRENVPSSVKNSDQQDNSGQELPPEIIEKIMEKVRDIYAYGTAYASVSGQGSNDYENKLGSILQYGLIGRDWRYKNNRGKSISPKEWREDVRERLNPVHFNIVGRTLAFDYGGGRSLRQELDEFKKTEPGNAGKPFPRMRGFNRVYSPPYIIFDISSFKETDSIFFDHDKKDTYKGSDRTYRIVAPRNEIDMTPDLNNKIGVGAEFGFQLHHRVSPRLIKGIVVWHEDQSEIEKIEKTMKTVLSDPQEMVPIYTIDNAWPPSVNRDPIKTTKQYEGFLKKSANFRLVWPKQMNYEEVKKFVEEKQKQ